MPNNPPPPEPENSPPKRRPLREIEPTDDPICSCEAEPRWLHFQEQNAHPNTPDEWQSLERTPKDEL